MEISRLYPVLLFLALPHIGFVTSECIKCSGDCRGQTLDFTFVVDGSGSICEDSVQLNCQYWKNILQFVANIVDHLNIGFDKDRIAFVQFANDAVVEFGLTRYTSKEALKTAILNIEHRGGNTNTSGGIRVMRKEVFFTGSDRLNVQNVAMVITDGISTRDPDLTVPEAKAARDSGIHIFSVGLTNKVDVSEIARISSLPQLENINYWLIRTYDEASSYQIIVEMFNNVCRSRFLTASPSAQRVSRCPGEAVGDDCYVLRETPMSWSAAEAECALMASVIGHPGGGGLATPRTEAIMTRLKDYVQSVRNTKSFVEREQLASFWVGGHEESAAFGDPNYPVWRWLEGNTLLEDQGCFKDSKDSPDVGTTSTVDDLTIGACKSRCYTRPYTAVQAGNKCTCGDTYGRYGTTDGCDTPCAGDATMSCGGTEKNRIFATGGLPGTWAKNQPSNYNQYQPCGSIEKSSSGSWALNDLGCFELLSYICAVPFSMCSRYKNNHKVVRNQCLNFVVTPRSWFNAREDCMDQGGDLVSLSNALLHMEVEVMLNTILYMHEPFWVGAYGRMWKWKTGEPLTYTHWSPDEPNDAGKNCLKLRADTLDRIWWNDEYCNLNLPFICHIDMSTQYVTLPVDLSVGKSVVTLSRISGVVNAPITTSVSPSVDNSYPSGNTNQSSINGTLGEPDAGASTGDRETVSSSYLFLIAFAVLLVTVVVIVIVLLRIHMSTNKKTELEGKAYITPALEQYDQAAFAPDGGGTESQQTAQVDPESPGELAPQPPIPKPKSKFKEKIHQYKSHIHTDKSGLHTVGNLVEKALKNAKTVRESGEEAKKPLATTRKPNYNGDVSIDTQLPTDRVQNHYEDIYLQATPQPTQQAQCSGQSKTPDDDIALPTRKEKTGNRLSRLAITALQGRSKGKVASMETPQVEAPERKVSDPLPPVPTQQQPAHTTVSQPAPSDPLPSVGYSSVVVDEKQPKKSKKGHKKKRSKSKGHLPTPDHTLSNDGGYHHAEVSMDGLDDD